VTVFDDIRPANVQLRFNHERTIDARFTDIHVDAMRLMFHAELFDTASGREALRRAQSGVLQGCSVGLNDYRAKYLDYGMTEVIHARLEEISLICGANRPAYIDTWARVEE
jgi:phage head maturation protease